MEKEKYFLNLSWEIELGLVTVFPYHSHKITSEKECRAIMYLAVHRILSCKATLDGSPT